MQIKRTRYAHIAEAEFKQQTKNVQTAKKLYTQAMISSHLKMSNNKLSIFLNF